MKEKDLNNLLNALVTKPKETEWLEFKLNFHSKEEIGERIHTGAAVESII